MARTQPQPLAFSSDSYHKKNGALCSSKKVSISYTPNFLTLQRVSLYEALPVW